LALEDENEAKQLSKFVKACWETSIPEQVSTIKDPKLIPGNKYGYLDLAVFTEISGRNDLTLSTDQVFAYDSNDNAVILQHQCPGWCSSCQQCQTTTTQNIDHHYTSGDIDLHERGVQ
jgi:hypothetical protein